jgi:alginate O-acetyltransferase complex protein AlgI
MQAFAASDHAIASAGAAMLAVLVVGFAVTRLRLAWARPLAWLSVIAGFTAVLRTADDEPPLFRMLAICGVVLFAMKGVVAVEDAARRDRRPGAAAWLAWAAAWPGMRPDLFLAFPSRPLPGGAALLAKGAIRLLCGAALLACARLSFAATGSHLLAAALALPGLSLVLHFGLFNLLAGAWRFAGVDACSLFDRPLAARSLSEFWGRRWNLPFTEMTQRAVYRPLQPLLGRDGAALAAFGFSGLLHEIAISLPVGAGYGRPMLYFLIHGGATRIEPRLRPAFERRPWLAHAWTLLWLAAPMPLLFHEPFITGVVWPMIGIR